MTKKLRIFNANRTTRKGGVVGRKRDRQVLAGIHEMPPGRKPNGAYEWDTTQGWWLNSDGSKFLAPPNTKPPRNVVGWDARKGEWMYALPKRQNKKRRRVFAGIAETGPPPLPPSSTTTTTTTTSPSSSSSSRTMTLSKPTIKAALPSHKHKDNAALTATTKFIFSAPNNKPKPLLVFVATRPPIPWSLTLQDRAFVHVDASGVDVYCRLPLYVSRCVRRRDEDTLSSPADKLVPSPPRLKMF